MKILTGNNPVAQAKLGQEITAEASRRVDTAKNGISKSKLDSSDISSERHVSFDDTRIATAKSAILYDVTVKNSDRLSELKEAVKNGTYHVPTAALVDALLK